MNFPLQRLVLVLLAGGIGCGAAFGQGHAETPLASRIRDGESVIATPAGRADGMRWLQLAILYQDSARYEDAEHAYREASGLLKAKDRLMYAEALDHMGTMFVEQGKFAKAEPLERKAFAIRQEEKDELAMGRSYMHLAMVEYGKHDLTGAEADAEMAVSLLAPEHGRGDKGEATPEEKMTALIDLSMIRCAKGECAATVADLDRALAVAHAHYAENSVPVGLLDFMRGNAYWKSGDAKLAPELMKRGIDEMSLQMGWGHPTYVAALKQYRNVLLATGSVAEAQEVDVRIAELRSPGSAAGVRTAEAQLEVSSFR